MFIRKQKPWQLPESAVTPESVYLNRRQFLRGVTGAGLAAGIIGAHGSALAKGFDSHQYPLTAESEVNSYVNFYEFGSHKGIADLAQAMTISPWKVMIKGMAKKEGSLDLDDLRRVMPLEERITMHRCVEAWAFVAPWQGFPLKALLEHIAPTSDARYVEFTTLLDKEVMLGLAQDWYPWPYTESITIEEAHNELAFLATGLYGKDLKPQNGAPLRLVLPWKYGFKSIKSIVAIRLTDQQPKSFWQKIAPDEYGFWANVNPDIPHPRWSQASHRMLGSRERVPTEIFNGYGEWVSDLYPNYDSRDRRLFF